MSAQLKEALAALELQYGFYAKAELAVIRSALEAAQQEVAAIEAYGRAHEYHGSTIFFSNGKWLGHITGQFKSLCSGDSYAEVHPKLAAWCRSELAK